MQLNPSASNALKESQIHHIFQGLNEHKYLPSHPNYRISTLSNGTSIKKVGDRGPRCTAYFRGGHLWS